MTDKNQNSKQREDSEKSSAQPEKSQQSSGEKSKEGNVSGDAKLWSIVGYIFPILFFVPLVMEELKQNHYSKYHANQQLVLLLTAIAVNIVGGIIPILGWFIILPFGGLAVIIFAIMGIINGVKEKTKPLPLIGKIEIIK
ncbi:MAG: hypothetical protein R6V40_02715 [Candidatus Moraniibacteriota bacterium]